MTRNRNIETLVYQQNDKKLESLNSKEARVAYILTG